MRVVAAGRGLLMLKVLEAEDSMSKKQWTNKAMVYRFSVSKSVSSQYISLWHPGMSSEYIYTITSSLRIISFSQRPSYLPPRQPPYSVAETKYPEMSSQTACVRTSTTRVGLIWC